jgi:MFS family permease
MREACSQDPENIIISGEDNVTKEFGLYCEQAEIASWSGTFYFVALMIGGGIFPWVSDAHGRRPALLLSCLITGVNLIGCALSPNFYVWIFTVSYFLPEKIGLCGRHWARGHGGYQFCVCVRNFRDKL